MLNILVLLVVSFLTAISTFYTSEKLNQGPVRSSALLSLSIALLFYAFPNFLPPYLVKNIPVVCIGASFVGMVSSRLLSNYTLIGAGGVIFCLIYLHTSNFFNGYGGALGTSAAIALLAVLSIPIVGKKEKLTNGLVQLRKILFKR